MKANPSAPPNALLVLSTSDTGRPLRSLLLAALALLFLAAGALVLMPLLTYPFGRDHGVFSCVADIVAGGGVPYCDAWEMKPPGIFYLFWASFALFGRSMASPRLLDLLWTLTTAVAIWHLGRRVLSPWAGVAGAFFFLVRYVAGITFWNTTQCEGFTSLPLTLAAIALVAAEQRRNHWLAAMCGALVALAMILKFTVGIFLLLPCVAVLAAQGDSARSRLARGASYLLGCVALLAALAGLMAWAGALNDMFEILFLWNAKYASLNPPGSNFGRELASFLVGGRQQLLFPIGLLALAGAADLTLRPQAGRIRWLLPIWALSMAAAVWIQGKYYTYHWLPLLPPMGLLAAQGLRAAWFLLQRSARARIALAWYVAGVVVLFAILGLAYWRSLQVPVRYALGNVPRSDFMRGFERPAGLGRFSLRANEEVAQFLRRRTAIDAPIFVWGFEPLIYHLAERAPASRFIYSVPLVTEWSPDEWRSELIRDLEQTPPAYIVVAHNDLFPWMTERWDDSAAQLGAFPDLEQLLRRDYRRARRIEDFDVWERRNDTQSDR